MFQSFASHRARHVCVGEYQHAVTVVDDFVITVTLSLLQLSQVSDQVNMALA